MNRENASLLGDRFIFDFVVVRLATTKESYAIEGPIIGPKQLLIRANQSEGWDAKPPVYIGRL